MWDRIWAQKNRPYQQGNALRADRGHGYVCRDCGGHAPFRQGGSGCFISGSPEDVAVTMNIAYHYLAIMSVFLPILYVLHVTRSALQGMGDTLLPMASGIAEFVMRTGTAILLPVFLGEEGIFYAEILAWIGADVILVTSY